MSPHDPKIFEFDKKFFQSAWGSGGYIEMEDLGVGIDRMAKVAIDPFSSLEKTALEIGPGGGSFTKRLVGKFKHLIAIDVIKRPKQFDQLQNFTFIELPDKNYKCSGVQSNSIDYCFSHGVFCHLPDSALVTYLVSIHRVLKLGGDVVFMISDYESQRQHLQNPDDHEEGDHLPTGHFYQNANTLGRVIDLGQWTVVLERMIPDHIHIFVHLRKK